jgi:hypothetical protein
MNTSAPSAGQMVSSYIDIMILNKSIKVPISILYTITYAVFRWNTMANINADGDDEIIFQISDHRSTSDSHVFSSPTRPGGPRPKAGSPLFNRMKRVTERHLNVLSANRDKRKGESGRKRAASRRRSINAMGGRHLRYSSSSSDDDGSDSSVDPIDSVPTFAASMDAAASFRKLNRKRQARKHKPGNSFAASMDAAASKQKLNRKRQARKRKRDRLAAEELNRSANDEQVSGEHYSSNDGESDAKMIRKERVQGMQAQRKQFETVRKRRQKGKPRGLHSAKSVRRRRRLTTARRRKIHKARLAWRKEAEALARGEDEHDIKRFHDSKRISEKIRKITQPEILTAAILGLYTCEKCELKFDEKDVVTRRIQTAKLVASQISQDMIDHWRILGTDALYLTIDGQKACSTCYVNYTGVKVCELYLKQCVPIHIHSSLTSNDF